MTLQETYNLAKHHLLTQNKRSVERKICKYRDNHGRKCGAGVFIPAEKYNPAMEGLLWENVNVSFGLNVPHAGFIQKVQRIHDRQPPHKWAKALQNLAHIYGLVP